MVSKKIIYKFNWSRNIKSTLIDKIYDLNKLLFRNETLDARRDKWLGRVQISQPLPIKIVSWGCIVLTIGTFFLLFYGTYSRRVHATGQVMPSGGIVTLGATEPGIISAIHATEGMHVNKGDIIFTEDLENTSITGPTQKLVLDELKKQRNFLENQRVLREKAVPMERQALLNQIQFLTRQCAQIENQLADDKTILPLVQNAMIKMQSAKSSHLITEAQFQSQLATYAQLINSHSQALQSHTSDQGKIADFAARLVRLDTDLAHDKNDFNKQIASIDQQIVQNEGRRSIIVLAPENGVLTGVRGYLGQQVTAGTTLVTLLPMGHSLQIDLYVNSSSIGFLREGEPVLLRYDAFPYQKFGLHHGHISEITRAPVVSDSQKDNETAQMSNDRTKLPAQDIYRIRVIPDQRYVETYGIRHPLEAGMTVSADIATDHRRLWEWLLDPIVSIQDTITTTTIGPK